MRFLIASVTLFCLAGLTAATAQTLTTWTDPKGQFSFQKPSAWPVDDETRDTPNVRRFVAGNADDECWFTLFSRPETASVGIDRIVKSLKTPLTEAQWLEASRTQQVFAGVTATFKNGAVADTALPLQTATFEHPENGTVIAALHVRQGLEVYVFCMSYTGEDNSALFEQVSRSFATPQDADLIAALAPAQPAQQ